MYSMVPQKLYARPLSSSLSSFDRPKSVMTMWPFASSRMFSSLMSR